MSKTDRAKKRDRKRYSQPSAPGPWKRHTAWPVEANDNHANDNPGRVRISGVWLTENQAVDYHNAIASLGSRDLEKRREAEATLLRIEREIGERIHGKAVERGLKERHELEALRGMAVGKSDIEGAVGVARIARDGLELLYARKAISKTQHDAGQRFRVDYEKMNPEKEMTPRPLDPAKEIVPHGGENWSDKRAEAIDRILCIYRMICGVDGRPGDKGMLPLLPRDHPAMRSISALNLIAGQGFMINELATGSRARARMKGDLTFALDACAIVHDLAPDDEMHTTS